MSYGEINTTLHFELTFKDYLEFNYYYLWTRPERLGYRITNSLLPLCVLLLLMYFSKGLNFELYGFGELVFLCLGILLFFLMPYFVKKGYSNSIRRLLDSGRNLTLLGSKSVVFDNDKVTEVTECSTSTILWSAFECFKENNEYFFLFQNTNQAIIIPKRAIATDIEVENLKLFIKSQLEVANNSTNTALDIPN
jgi:hypothetical protein